MPTRVHFSVFLVAVIEIYKNNTSCQLNLLLPGILTYNTLTIIFYLVLNTDTLTVAMTLEIVH